MISSKLPQSFIKEDKRKTLIFVYGTLMDSRTRDFVFHHKEKATKASISGWKKVPFTTKEGSDFNTIVRDPAEKELKGDVLAVDSHELDQLKKWEDLYHLVSVRLNDGREAQAFQLNKDAEIKKE